MADVIRAPRTWWLSPRVRTVAALVSAASGLVIAIIVGSGASSPKWLLVLFAASLALAIGWVAAGWKTSIMVLGLISLLPVVGVLRLLDQEEAGDVLAISAFFMLLAAVVGESIARRITSRGSAPLASSSPSEITSPVDEAKGWRSRVDYVVVLAACFIVPQTWLSFGSLLAFGDFAPLSFLRPEIAAEKLYPLWSTFSEGLGGRNFTVVNAPLVFLSDLLNEAGFSGSMTQRVIFTGLLLCQGIGIVHLLRLVWPRSSHLARIGGGLFYVFNVLALFSLPGLVQMTAFALMPFLTSLMLKGFVTGKSLYIVLFALCSAGLAYVGANPPLVLVVGLAACLVSTVVYRCSGGSFRTVARFLALALPLSALLNAWWIVPLLLSLSAGGASHIPVTPDQWNWTHVRNSISNLFTLNTNWAWPQKIYYPYSDAYESAVLQVGVFIPAMLAFGALAVRKSRNARPALWLILACLVMFFVGKGVHEPFGTVNEFLLTEVPGMWLLREPASKLLPIVVLVFALLICFTINNALNNSAETTDRTRRWAWRAIGASGLALPLLAFPILTGEFAWGERPILPDARTRVPGYWYRAADALGAESSPGAVLLLPLDDFYAMPYSWGYYGPDSVPVELIRRPTVMGGQLTYLTYDVAAADPRRQLQQALINWDYASARHLLHGLGVGFVLVRGDIDYDLLGQLGRSAPRPESLAPMLDQSPLFELMGRFGPLSLYRVADRSNGPVSAWPAHSISPESDALPPDEVLYTGRETAVLNGAGLGAEENASGSEAALERLPLRLSGDGVESESGALKVVWENPVAGHRHASHYLREPDGRLRRLRFNGGGSAELIMPWGRLGLLDVWETTAGLVADPSFEGDGLREWRGLSDCPTASAGARLRTDFARTVFHGRKVVRLSGDRPEACVARDVRLEEGGVYEISITHRTLRGRGPGYCIFIPTEGGGRCLERRMLSPRSRWRTSADILSIHEPLDGARLLLFPGGSASVEFDRVQLSRIERARTFAIDWSQIGTKRGSRLDLDIDGSSARYVVKVEDANEAFVLTLNQTFDPSWNLTAGSGRDLDATHTVVNGFANGWLVEGESEFVIEFGIDRWVVYARWVSVLVGATLLAAAVALRRRGRRSGG
jgi:hypothetical protein